MALFTGTQKAYYEGGDGNFNSGDESYGNYQFISLNDLVGNFLIAYVGEGKVIPRVKRQDVFVNFNMGETVFRKKVITIVGEAFDLEQD